MIRSLNNIFLSSYRSKGFSLLEMSVVLLIVSIIIGGGLMIFDKYSSQSNVKQTQERIETVLTALKQYGKRYGRLPCAADPTVAFTDANYGMEISDGGVTSCGALIGATPWGVDRGSGMIPTATLGLYPTMGLDAWGRRMKYIVVSDYAEAADTSLDAVSSPGIDVRTAGDSTYNYTSWQGAAVLIISYGENGFGAYPGRGGTQPSSEGNAATQEMGNIYDTTELSAFPPFNGFDDVVGFLTYEQLKSDLME